MAKRISVINFKGGVGKTTFALHLATYMARYHAGGKKVLMVDVDHQSSLSTICMDAAPWEVRASTGNTVNRVFSHFSIQGAAMPGAEIVVKAPFNKTYPSLDLVPAQFELDDTEIDLASTTIGNPIASEWRKRTLLSRWLSDSGIDAQFDYIVFDCPPATKIVSQNAIAASHAFVVPTIPDSISIRGVTHFVNLIGARIDGRLKSYAASVAAPEMPSCYVPDTLLAGIVISNAQTHGPAASGYINEHTTQMHALRLRWGDKVLKHVIDRAAGVAESIGSGWPVYDRADQANVSGRDLPTMFKNVCSELLSKLGW